MRDRDRIEPVLDAIRRAWEENPDLRLGQLRYSAVAQARNDVSPCPPLFYIDDDSMADAVTALHLSSAE